MSSTTASRISLKDADVAAVKTQEVVLSEKSDVRESPKPEAHETSNTTRGPRFWLVYVALCISLLLAALDLVRFSLVSLCSRRSYDLQGAVGTAAPTIVSDLNGQDFAWVASAYSLASAACLPFSGKLAQMFGRRETMLGALTIFAVGSAVSGAASSMNMLIVGRG